MIGIKIGIVAEGGGDSITIKHLVSAYFQKKYEGKCDIEFKSVQPYVDNTSLSGYSAGGWEQVYKWCLNNPPEYRSTSLFGQPLFADGMDEQNYSALIIHMDADICEVIGNKSDVEPVPTAADPAEVRGLFIENVLTKWLWPHGEDVEDLRHVVAPAVESIEAWLVAGLCEDEVDPENHADIQRKLAELDYSVVRKRSIPKGIKCTSKSAANFERLARFAAPNVGRIVEYCPHFKKVVDRTQDFIQTELEAA